MSTTAQPSTHDVQLAESMVPFVRVVQDLVQEEVARACKQLPVGSGESSGSAGQDQDLVSLLVDRAADLFGTDAWKKEVNTRIEEALQAILPGLIKRFRADIEKYVGGGGGGGEAQAPMNLKGVVNSAEMKEALEERFRTMLLYIKQEVIPKAVKACLASA